MPSMAGGPVSMLAVGQHELQYTGRQQDEQEGCTRAGYTPYLVLDYVSDSVLVSSRSRTRLGLGLVSDSSSTSTRPRPRLDTVSPN